MFWLDILPYTWIIWKFNFSEKCISMWEVLQISTVMSQRALLTDHLLWIRDGIRLSWKVFFFLIISIWLFLLSNRNRVKPRAQQHCLNEMLNRDLVEVGKHGTKCGVRWIYTKFQMWEKKIWNKNKDLQMDFEGPSCYEKRTSKQTTNHGIILSAFCRTFSAKLSFSFEKGNCSVLPWLWVKQATHHQLQVCPMQGQ